MSEHDDQQHDSTSTENVIESVRELIDMMKAGGISELDLRAGEMKVRLRSEAASRAAAPVMSMPQMMPPAMGQWPSFTGAPADSAMSPVPEAVAEAPALGGHVVASPMIGTFYSASAPGEPAFVQEGDEVEVGQQIGIIEAMKIMNEITADKSGVVVEIMVENAQAVEYGTPLVRISTSGPLD